MEVQQMLDRSDRRFLGSWQSYLARIGDDAKIGPCRLANLRKVWSGYFADAAHSTPGIAPLAASASAKG